MHNTFSAPPKQSNVRDFFFFFSIRFLLLPYTALAMIFHSTSSEHPLPFVVTVSKCGRMYIKLSGLTLLQFLSESRCRQHIFMLLLLRHNPRGSRRIWRLAARVAGSTFEPCGQLPGSKTFCNGCDFLYMLFSSATWYNCGILWLQSFHNRNSCSNGFFL